MANTLRKPPLIEDKSGFNQWVKELHSFFVNLQSISWGLIDTTGSSVSDADTVDGSHASAFAVAAKGVTNGDTHDHAGGDGGTVDHTSLGSKGTNTHAQLDDHLADTSDPHGAALTQTAISMGTAGTTMEVASTGDAYWVGNGTGLPYAQIYVKDSVATITVDQDVADALVTQWTNNGLSNNCTPDSANDKITITKAGVYLVMFNATIDLDAGLTVEVRIEGYLNGTIQPQLHLHRTVSSTDKGSVSFSGFIDVTAVPWDLDVRANINSSTARALNLEDAQLNVLMVGGT